MAYHTRNDLQKVIRRAKQEDVCIYFGFYVGWRTTRERGKNVYRKRVVTGYFREIRNNYSMMTDAICSAILLTYNNR